MKEQYKKASQIKDKPFDFVLFITVLILLAMGLVMVLSASSPWALSHQGNSYYFAVRQLIFAVIGIVLMLIISNIDYRIYSRFWKMAYWGSIALSLSVLVFGRSSKGAERWIELGILRFQPSEVVKIALIVFFATWITKNKDTMSDLKKGFIVPFLYLIPIALILVFVQNHLSVTIIIILVISIMMLLSGSKLKYFITFGTIGAISGGGLLFLVSKLTNGEIGGFRIGRIATFLNPWNDVTGDGWQIVQSLYAIGSRWIIWSRAW